MEKEIEHTSCKNAQLKAHGVILVRHQEETPIHHDAPNENIGDDPSGQVVCTNSHSTNPVQRHKVPRQRATHNTDMDGARSGAVPEIGGAEIEEVDDNDEQGKPEEGTGPEMDKGEDQQVVHNEVASHVGGGRDIGCLGRVQVPGVAELEEVQNDPGYSISFR